MTRLESGTLSLKRDWIPLDEVIGSALTRLEESLSNRPVKVDIPREIPLILVDPVLFEQIFVNLIENACKYTSPGTPIEARATRERDVVVIEFRDHGPGIPAGCEEKLFEKFYRGSHVGVSGAGLGLPICRGIAEAHGGSIRAENAAGGGVLFHIIVPIGGEPPGTSKVEGITI
jgi:two-component system sensor histidine kinase KdpD